MRRLSILASGMAVVLTLLACAPQAEAPPNGVIAVAVLGDSDSHGYRDRLDNLRRGGAYHEKTFNWLEIWARLRSGEIDPGPMVAEGGRTAVSSLKSFIGRPTRVPRKEDYLYNYAYSGAHCAGLARSWPHEAHNLIVRLKSEPERWKDGLVVIRIGVNDFGEPEHLQQWARDPRAAEAPVDACIEEIGTATKAIRRASTVHIALIGIAHDYDTPMAADAVADAEVEAVAEALDRFDAGLADIARNDPRIVFVDDVVWFTDRFGTRRLGTLKPSATSQARAEASPPV